MRFVSYEWPDKVDDNFAYQITSELVNVKSPFDPLSGVRAVMLGASNEDAEGVRITLLVEGDQVLGYALYTVSEFKDIYVLQEHRYNRYADKLLDEAKQWYRSNGTSEVEITIASTEQARRFWEHRAIHGGMGESRLLIEED